MFRIKFKIFDSLIEDNDGLKGEYGYFLFSVNENNYGEYRDDVDLDIFSTDIYDWFVNFIEAINLLKTKKEVYISDVETQEVWIELTVLNIDTIKISEIRAEKPEGSLAVETDIELHEKSTVWEEIVQLSDVKRVLLSTSEDYLAKLKKINDTNNDYIEKLIALVDEM
ncbi:hypothetical protein EQW38_01685 [Lactiplantibacillus plantarum]|uniref:hypothetical protein n=1 Tax=Lactiplantibacillus plantarum TaxID=1590 RepID=UPI000FFE19C0|nr:hypothetical protein [Lactiplantibacillus plantarum]QAT29003.1 hypothetical protein EQW38_01685 [Lactiplantibacillus plantarum]QAT34265.1 hypothetical protein EQW06_14155 [Lactiplantibacillus plantarum]